MTPSTIPCVRDVLKDITAHLPQQQETYTERKGVCDFLRETEGDFFVARDPAVADAIRELLGWDDETLHTYTNADAVVQSSPHASMNAFGQRCCYTWLASNILQHIAEPEATGVHVRTTLTHNNLGDLKWRTYAWWHRTASGNVHKLPLFSRNHKVRHKTLLSQPSPKISLEDLNNIDQEAIKLAKHASNYAYFCIIYMLFIERACSFRTSKTFMELPIDVINRFNIHSPERRTRFLAFLKASGHPPKIVKNNGELKEITLDALTLHLSDNTQEKLPQVVCSNALNFAQIYRLGVGVMVGGSHMAEYTTEMNTELTGISNHMGETITLPKLFPVTRFPTDRIMPLDGPAQSILDESQVPNSLSIAYADHGSSLRSIFDTLLSDPADTITDTDPIERKLS